ncbi:hypothetical protein TSOC_000578 [Tetrabaena socialis]|uniref:Phosphatidic acid phosphatase type 2/haloperoxidase domain-containing protein n=1 Tax=Tetrabaena socialis TaxID=47790 RepID=A0A2J8AIY1_9CHLO|nr:hypothetical protein TSOC_000578 [Tetrabaena socialis]|eukprot:PNH12474.1 hypothetical protein TSOC_000578 [Tetrabaena socialis]
MQRQLHRAERCLAGRCVPHAQRPASRARGVRCSARSAKDVAPLLAPAAPPALAPAPAPAPAPNPAPWATFSSPVAHPAFIVLGLTAYSAVAIDVFVPDSLHLLQPMDEALHQWTLSTIDPAVRKQLFGGVLSNGWTVTATFGWIAATSAALTRVNPLAWRATALAWALWIFGVGPVEHDPALMHALKTNFGRARPSPIHRSASFPSGHTAADVLCVGSLLFVLLPVAFPRVAGPGGGGSRGSVDGGSSDGAGGADAGNGASSGTKLGLPRFIYDVQHSWTLLALSVGTTIVGRVGVDAHWLSDTLAGGSLGLALVAGLASATQRLAAADVRASEQHTL